MSIGGLWTQGKQQLVSFMKKTLLLVCTVLISNVALAVENREETAPVRISCPFPFYPASAKALGIGGTVKYSASVNEKGEVTSVETTGAEPFFREVKYTIKKCKFEPGKPGVAKGTIRFRPTPP
ncbi:TonB family protein [Klebsiella sp. B345]|uniref:TonB family protein n=1 Tax=Klebsiella sp. B345 TaxID=2755398 RepID=UPI003DA90582